MPAPLEKYKDIFGKPKEGIHKYRIGKFAAADILMTIVVAVFISFKFKKSFLIVVVALFMFAIFLHGIFGVDTTLNKMIFGKKDESIVAKS